MEKNLKKKIIMNLWLGGCTYIFIFTVDRAAI